MTNILRNVLPATLGNVPRCCRTLVDLSGNIAWHDIATDMSALSPYMSGENSLDMSPIHEGHIHGFSSKLYQNSKLLIKSVFTKLTVRQENKCFSSLIILHFKSSKINKSIFARVFYSYTWSSLSKKWHQVGNWLMEWNIHF